MALKKHYHHQTKRWEMARLLVLVLPPLGILAFTEAMSIGLLVLENKGENWKLTLLGLLAFKICPL